MAFRADDSPKRRQQSSLYDIALILKGIMRLYNHKQHFAKQGDTTVRDDLPKPARGVCPRIIARLVKSLTLVLGAHMHRVYGQQPSGLEKDGRKP